MRPLAYGIFALALGVSTTAGAVGVDQPGALTPTTLKLPPGPGSLRGLSDDPQPNLFSGQVQYNVPIELPGAVHGFRPSLNLEYSGDLGNGPMGIGWTLALPEIRRTLRLGVPNYTDADEIELTGIAGGGRLVALPDGSYRLEGQGNAVKITKLGLGYQVVDASGVKYRFGVSPGARQSGAPGTQAWKLEAVVDLAGQQIQLSWQRDDGDLYLQRMQWGPGQRYRADLKYEARADAVVSFRRGYRVGTGQRLKTVQVAVAGAPLRSYELAYDTRLPVSRLSSVTEKGSDGATSLPTVSFDYGQPQSPALTSVGGTDGWRVGRDASFLDVDGDGVADLVRLTASAHEYRRNLGGSFGPTQSIPGSPGVGLDTARLMDVYGDARPELVMGNGSGWSVFRLLDAQWVLQGTYAGSLNLPVIASYAADLDINGDGRTDVLVGRSGGIIWYHNTGSGMEPLNRGPIAGDSTLAPDSPGVRFFDVNGDGLDDVIRLGQSSLTYYLGHGDGTFDAGLITPYPWGTAATALANLLLCDLNRDGLMDVARVDSGNVSWYRGLPGGRFEASAQTLPRPAGSDTEVIVSLADLHGDGSQDLVWAAPNGVWSVDLAGPTTAGMLSRVDNRMGKVTRYSYSASAVLELADEAAGNGAWTSKLPVSIPLPVTRTVDPGAGQPQRTVTYGVRDGMWDYDERRFCGFQTATQTWAGIDGGEARSEVTSYHLGLGADRVLRGKPLVVRTYHGGTLHQMTRYTWTAGAIAGLPDVPLAHMAELTNELHWQYEGLANGTAITTSIQRSYDAQGNRAEERDNGRLDLAGDERIVRRTFASDDSTWVRNVLVEEQLLAGDGKTVVSDRKSFYGDNTQQLPFGQIGKGWLRETDELLVYGNENRWVTTRQLGYDALGQPTAVLENGVLRKLGYDTLDLHPVSESVDPAPGTTLTWRMAWDPTLDLPTDRTEPDGQTTHVDYDPLGRVRAMGLANRPAYTLYQYDWTAPAPKTWTYQFDGADDALAAFAGWQPGSGWRQSVAVADGAGEPLFQATHLDGTSWIVRNLHQLDARGRVVSVAEPFLAGGIDGLNAAPAGTGVQTLAYDALDRLSTQTLPTQGTLTRSYAAFAETETRTDLAPISRQLDGLGRVVHTERTVGDSRERIDATYDPAGRITVLSLQDGAVQHRFAYDTLGRLRSGLDPDAGARAYGYDDGGHVLTKSSGAGQVTIGYDGAGRPLSVTDAGGKRYAYHYDTARVPGGDNSAGRLAWVEEPSGSVDFGYDAQGRQRWMRRTIGGVSAEKTVRYSPSGLILSLASDDGFVAETHYDAAGRPVGVSDLWTATTLDPAGRVLEERFGNGVRQVYDRDPSGLTSRIQVLPPGGAALYDVTIERNGLGVLRGVTDQDGVGLDHGARFQFDGAARLVEANLGSGAFDFTYGYDALSNLVARNATGGRGGGALLGQYLHGENGAGPRQLSSIVGDDGSVTHFTYDAAGRQTQNDALTLGYDGFDQLTTVSRDGAPLVEYAYGYDGQRVSSRGSDGAAELWFTEDLALRHGAREHYVRVGGRTLAKVTLPATASAASRSAATLARAGLPGMALLLLLLPLLAGRTRRQRWLRSTATLTLLALLPWAGCGGGAHSAKSLARLTDGASVLYFHQGVTAGPVLFTNADGSLAEERRFEPFGQPLEAAHPGVASAAVDFALEPTNGLDKQTDPLTGFSYHGARWLDPRTAQWTACDPPAKAPDAELMRAPWKLNPYQYVDQNPVVFWDPDGRAPTVVNESTDLGYTPGSSWQAENEWAVDYVRTSATVSATTSTTAPAQSSTPKTGGAPPVQAKEQAQPHPLQQDANAARQAEAEAMTRAAQEEYCANRPWDPTTVTLAVAVPLMIASSEVMAVRLFGMSHSTAASIGLGFEKANTAREGIMMLKEAHEPTETCEPPEDTTVTTDELPNDRSSGSPTDRVAPRSEAGPQRSDANQAE